MRRFWIAILLLTVLALPVSALEIKAPEAPEMALPFIPRDPQNLGEGIRYVLTQAILKARPDLKEAFGICNGVILTVMIVALMGSLPGMPAKTGVLLGTVSVSALLLSRTGALVDLAAEVVTQISQYGKLLLPVMTGAMAAQGGVGTSAGLYVGTVAFNALLSGLISGALIPLIYCYFALSTVRAVSDLDFVKRIRDTVKNFSVWLLKTILYVFTAYMGITGVVSGSTDAASLKAAKLTISSVVPVVGGILSDASEAVLVSAGVARNAVGIYGMFALLGIWISPFAKIGVHYLLIRFSGMICSIFGQKELSELVNDYGSGMGILLGMTAAVCLLFLISVFCFMRGVG